MKSMTGYGKADSQQTDYSLDVVVRSVNGRYLDIKLISPKLYTPLEIEIRKIVGKEIKRGSVDLFINRKSFKTKEKIQFDQKLAQQWLQGFNKVTQELGLEKVRDPRILLSIPELVHFEEPQSLGKTEKNDLFKTLDQALKNCLKVKVQEGESLNKDIKMHLAVLKKQLLVIKKLRQTVVQDLPQKFQDRLEKLGAKMDLEPQRIYHEISLLIERTDISEEIQRLETHLVVLDKLLKASEPIGKKLDFYAQELLREVNTIGSKSSDSAVTQAAVECKSIIEKYREQVQNVE